MITSQFLHSISNIVKITQLTREAKLNYQTIISKIREGRDLTTTESAKIEKVLKKYKLNPETQPETFNIDNYSHLTATQLMHLEDNDLKGKILEYYGKQAAEHFELLEGDVEVYDY